uniref:Transposase n=1 Tax=Macrostomum lignano TaxID=282301 RepID=A0A1I8ISN9_9PLAT
MLKQARATLRALINLVSWAWHRAEMLQQQAAISWQALYRCSFNLILTC